MRKDVEIISEIDRFIKYYPSVKRIRLPADMFDVLKESTLRCGLFWIKEDSEFEYRGRRIYRSTFPEIN